MSDRNIELTRRKVLGGLASIGAASAAAGAGTMALFSDTESSTGNSVQAGTLDLSNGIANTSLNITDAKPGDKGYVVWSLANNGSIGGDLDVNIGSLQSDGSVNPALATAKEGDDPDPEREAEGGSVDSDTELDEKLTVSAHFDASASDSQGVYTGDFTPGSGANSFVQGKSLKDALGSYDTSTALAASGKSGDSTKLVFEYELPSDTGNEVQGETVAVDVQVELNQDESQ